MHWSILKKTQLLFSDVAVVAVYELQVKILHSSFLLYFEKKYYNVDITVGCYHHGQHLAQGHQKD